MKVLGIDVGASGIKGGIVDTEKGALITERYKLGTPKSGLPEEMLDVMLEIVDKFDWRGKPIGIGFPAIIKDNKVLSASNISKKWINFPITKAFKKLSGSELIVINDADAAGLAELKFGKGNGVSGTWMLLTLGTGIGSALFYDDILIPNTEFGQLKYRKGVTEHYASNSARKKLDLSWEAYGKELNEVLEYIAFIFSPNKIILGGGISKKLDLYLPFLNKDLNVTAASTYNSAGIIGAAIAYEKRH